MISSFARLGGVARSETDFGPVADPFKAFNHSFLFTPWLPNTPPPPSWLIANLVAPYSRVCLPFGLGSSFVNERRLFQALPSNFLHIPLVFLSHSTFYHNNEDPEKTGLMTHKRSEPKKLPVHICLNRPLETPCRLGFVAKALLQLGGYSELCFTWCSDH